MTDGVGAVGLPLGVIDGTDESESLGVEVGVSEVVGGAALVVGGGALVETVGSRPGGEPEFCPGGRLPDGWCGPLGPDRVGTPGSVGDTVGSVGGAVPVGSSVGADVGVSLGWVGDELSVGSQVGSSDGGVLVVGSPTGPGCSA